MKKKSVKRWIGVVAGLLCFALLGCGKEADTNKTTGQEGSGEVLQEQESTEPEEELLSGKHHVNIYIKDMGVIAVELDADSAPMRGSVTVSRLVCAAAMVRTAQMLAETHS